MNPTKAASRRATEAVKGIGAEARGAGFTWRVTVAHLGNNGYRYERFCGVWQLWTRTRIPSPVRRELAANIKANLEIALAHARGGN